jgi:hypothetical protein
MKKQDMAMLDYNNRHVHERLALGIMDMLLDFF